MTINIELESLIDGEERVKDLHDTVIAIEPEDENITDILPGGYGNYNVLQNNKTQTFIFTITVLAGTEYDKFLISIINNRFNFAPQNDRRFTIKGGGVFYAFNIVNRKASTQQHSINSASNPETGYHAYILKGVLISGIIPTN
jgi:hypothetical protein